MGVDFWIDLDEGTYEEVSERYRIGYRVVKETAPPHVVYGALRVFGGLVR